MKYFLALLFSVFFLENGYAQKDSLVEWKVEAIKQTNHQYKLIASAKLASGWHLYGHNPLVNGLEDLQFVFAYEFAKAIGTVQFTTKAKKINDELFDHQSVSIYEERVQVEQIFQVDSFIPSKIKGTINAYIGKGNEFHPTETEFEVVLEGGVALKNDINDVKITSIHLQQPLNDCGATNALQDNHSLWNILFLGFVGGLIALLTPCVFPMIPVTVSFFTRRAANRKQAIKNGLLYGFFILMIYLIASLPFHLLINVNPEIFNTISTNAPLNLVFFVVFIFFSISFFGFFEINLPSSVAGTADSKAGLSSIGGIFFMALTLAIVSFSCTGPILGSLLVGSLTGGAWQLTAGLAGFGFALGLPFALFAIFPNWLHSLPKSGGWLDTVKKILAFAEVAFAFKFFSNADLVMHWGLMKREVFFALWILVGTGLTLFLFGKIHLPHDDKSKIGIGRKALGVLVLLFTLYLIPGVTSTPYANVKLLSGFPPPLSYSIYGKKNVEGKGLEANVMNDYTKALELARKQNKPILIDMTGWACVNCRKMEENVWTDPAVFEYIQSHYILLSLYVDDRQYLEPTERIMNFATTDGHKKDITTVGDKWATFESENFGQTTQPLYALIDTKERLLNRPVGYTPDIKSYLAWLTCGKKTFDTNNK